MSGKIYIGLKDVVGDDKLTSFKWVGDNSTMTYTNWFSGPWIEPNSVNETCTDMDMSTGKWNDVFCSLTQGGVCEIAPVSHILHKKKNIKKVCYIQLCAQT